MERRNVPAWLKWTMTFINRVGFPIVVCFWLAYQQFVISKETVATINNLKFVLEEIRIGMNQQNKYFRKYRD